MFMKQIIVLIAMIILGIALAGFIGNFKSTVGDVTNKTNDMLKTELTSIGGITK